MFKSVLAGVLLAATVVGAAAAEPFDSYKRFCLQPDLSARSISSTAQSEGWYAMPEEGMASVREGGFQDAVLFMDRDPYSFRGRGVPQGLQAVLGGRAPSDIFGIPGVEAEVCVAISTGESVAELNNRLSALFDFEPAVIDGMKLWIFSRGESGFRSETALAAGDLPDMRVAVNDRRIYVAAAMADDGMMGMVVGMFVPGD